jgi:uncharacterized membrane protein YccC
MPIDPFGGFGLLGAAFGVIFVIVGLAVAAGFAFTIYLIVRNASKVTKSGHDPLTLRSDLAVKALDSSLLAEKTSIEDRLREIDDLLSRKVISEPEHAAARTAILAS